jgi:hypothetical protein
VASGRAGVRVLGAVVASGLVLSCAVPTRLATQAPAWRRDAVRGPAVGRGWPRAEVLDLALTAYECGRTEGLFDASVLTVIDYTLPSTARRLWVLDLAAGRVLFHELVAHGERSGETFATAFSNRPGSRQSSLGLFRTEDVYHGRHGESLRLTGLEPGVNDRAMDRAIVMHGAVYVSRGAIAARGRLGRSWGCPALEHGVHRRVIDRIKGGTAVFAYYPEPHWLGQSRFVHCESRVASRE